MKFNLEQHGIFFKRGDNIVCWGSPQHPCHVCRAPTNYAVVRFDKIVYGMEVCSDECLAKLEET